MSKLFSDADVIYRYTRAQALADGVLVDVTEWASPRAMLGGGFTIPVAMTAAVWAHVQGPDRADHDVRGRAHDVLWLAFLAARRHRNRDRASFTVRIGGQDAPMWVHIGPGDHGEPVATILLEGED